MTSLAAEPLRPATVEELVQASKAPPKLVARALAPLEEMRLVQRVDGGYRLGFHRRAIHLSDIVEALRTETFPTICPLGACSSGARCALCWALVEAEVAASEVLHRQTLADLIRLLDAQPAPSAAELAG